MEHVPGQAPLGTVEILGLSAGKFDPALWESNHLNWVPDIRVPFLAPRQGGFYRNIYAPSVTEEPYGWRLFYGAWDGVPTGNDRIYSVTTRDFIDLDHRSTVIEHGDFVHVCNVNVQKLEDNSYHMICTAYPDPDKLNKPIYFSSRDGHIWNGTSEPIGARVIRPASRDEHLCNGTPEPHRARMSELVQVQNYAPYAQGDLNGGNVLLRDQARWILYFLNWKDPNKTYWAEGNDPRTFALGGVALEPSAVVNDVKRFSVAGKDWFLMGLHRNCDTLWYSLANSCTRFQPQKTLFTRLYPADRYIVAIGFVCQGERLLGVIYGAGPVSSLDRNALFARWLQKKIVLADPQGAKIESDGALGPDRQRLKLPEGKPFEGTLTLWAEDGVTIFSTQPVKLAPGAVYRLSSAP